MVPEGWKLEALSDAVKVIDCKHRTPKYVDSGIPLISPGTIKWGTLDLNSPVKRVSESEYESLMDHCTVDIGDLVMSRNQSLGIASYVESHEPFVLGQDTVLIKPIKANIKFIFYKLQSDTVQKNIIKLAGGSTFSRINLADIRKLKVSLPPISQQKKIAQILSTWDKAITTTEQLLANSQQQKKALMQQLLTGKKRLLDENGVRFSGEWKDTALSEMGRIVSGGTPDTKNEEYWGGSVSWLTPTDVTALKSRYVESTSRTITEKGVKESSATLLPPRSLMVCTRATVGAAAISASEITTNQGFKNLIPSKQFDVEFIYYLIAHFNKKLTRKASGSTFLELSKRDFEKTTFECPNLKEQMKISEVLANADQELETLNKKLSRLKCEKKALMQQLLTGKRRVNVDEEVA